MNFTPSMPLSNKPAPDDFQDYSAEDAWQPWALLVDRCHKHAGQGEAELALAYQDAANLLARGLGYEGPLERLWAMANYALVIDEKNEQ